MNPVLGKIFETGYAETPSGEFIKVHSAISQAEGEFLEQLIMESKPSVTLEIGLAFGVSALFICDALVKTPQARHIIIDPDRYKAHSLGDSWGGIGLYNLEKAGFKDMIEFYNAPSYQVLPQLEKAGRKIDFAFIDGWHTFDYVMVDFFYIDKMLRNGGLVVFDDANWSSIRKVCRYIITNLTYSVFRTLESVSKNKVSLKRRFLNYLMSNKIFSEKMHNWIKQEILESDLSLGLNSSMIAFKKKSEDKRRWDHHISF